MSMQYKTLLNFSVVIVTLALLISAIQLFYLFTPMSFWIEYESVVPTGVAKVGYPVKFRSIAETHRSSNVRFNDVLFCKFNGEKEFDYYMNYESGAFGKKPIGLERNDWTFHPAITLAGECYCKSNIVLQLPFNVEKVQTIVGPVFKVTE